MQRRIEATGLIVLVATTTALIVGLHQVGSVAGFRIDWSSPVEWLKTAPAEDVAVAILRSIGLVVGYWVTGSTLLYTVLALRGRSSGGRLVRLITVPGVRRVVDRSLATFLAASIVATPLAPALALADEQPPPVVFDINTDGVPVPHIRLSDAGLKDATLGDTRTSDTVLVGDQSPTTTQPITDVVPVVKSGGTPPAVIAQINTAPPTATPISSMATTHTVQSGDNLWQIATGHLLAQAGTDPGTTTVTTYWRRLVAANRTTLRSGDTNLIYPGEIITLPPLEVSE
ncbi:MAG: LysM domain-containing protein [Actinomycetota bacterium]|nr:LysM domain-containing protein [Actinomycetota bacterium]